MEVLLKETEPVFSREMFTLFCFYSTEVKFLVVHVNTVTGRKYRAYRAISYKICGKITLFKTTGVRKAYIE